MAVTLNRRLAQLVDSNGQLNTGKIPNDYITSDHVADNTITAAMLHTSFTVSTSNLTAIDTDDVSEGSSNLYFTNARADARIAAATTDDLSEGSTNLYYTTARWDTKMASADTDDLSEGSTNLYFTNARIDSHLSGGTGVTYSSGAISIGQDVGTTATPTFGNITTTGYIAGPATFTIDPAAVGDNTGTVVIAGNLQVDGTTTTINSTTVNVDDLNIQLATGAANAAAADGAGITVDGASATITYDGTNDRWDFNKNISADNGLFFSSQDFYFYRSSADVATLRVGDSGSYKYFSFTDTGSVARFSSASGPVSLGSGANDHLLINSSGNVGIGTNSPTSVLHVSSTPASGYPLAEISNTSNTTATSYGLSVQGGGNSAGAGYQFQTKDMDGNVDFFIRGDGDVGIGTASPKTTLNVAANNSGQGAILTLENTDTSITSNDVIGQIDFYANDGSTNGTGAKVNIKGIATSTAGTITALTFGTSDSTSSTATERMRIDSSGVVSITNSADASLKVETSSGTNSSRLFLKAPTREWRIGVNDSFNSGSLFVYNTEANTYPFLINTSGNVGIGTTSPNDKLEVSGGNIRIYSVNNANHLIIKNNAFFKNHNKNL